MVSYDEKHNEANQEDNKDGETHNNSWNCGVEGPTEDAEILQLREQQKRNFMATLLLSQGVPMICSGDEYGRTQFGNNNVYCQDNEISWFNWEWEESHQAFFDFTQNLMSFRHDSPALHRRRFFQGRNIHGEEVKDIRWIRTDGEDMTDEEWNTSFVRSLGMMLNGQVMDEVDEKGNVVKDRISLILVNSYWKSIEFKLPKNGKNPRWEMKFDTSNPTDSFQKNKKVEDVYHLNSRSLVMLQQID